MRFYRFETPDSIRMQHGLNHIADGRWLRPLGSFASPGSTTRSRPAAAQTLSRSVGFYYCLVSWFPRSLFRSFVRGKTHRWERRPRFLGRADGFAGFGASTPATVPCSGSRSPSHRPSVPTGTPRSWVLAPPRARNRRRRSAVTDGSSLRGNARPGVVPWLLPFAAAARRHFGTSRGVPRYSSRGRAPCVLCR